MTVYRPNGDLVMALLNGTLLADLLNGTNDRDVIIGMAGNDTIYGLDGLCCTNRLMAGVPLSPDRLIPRAL